MKNMMLFLKKSEDKKKVVLRAWKTKRTTTQKQAIYTY